MSRIAGLERDSFGDLARRARIAAGLTQEELAEQTGMSVRAIGDIERGRTTRPRRGSVELLVQALGLTAGRGGQRGAESRDADRARDGARRLVPRQLPAAVRQFVGRADELGTLTRFLDELDDAGGTVAISAVGGSAGVGKTALAVHWAHMVADRFPDGQLYVNLRGYDPRQPVTTAHALARFLRAIGGPGQDIPAEVDERAAQYRSLLAGRRMLVVLDNAASAEQVRPLLPGAPACMVIVTSRDSLTGLVAREGATRLDLDLLPLPDAVLLLKALIGARVDADRHASELMAEMCCRLPLALRLAAELAAARPAVPLTDLAAELADQQRRLDLLDAGGDRHTAVRAVFSWSYRHLGSETARAFRFAGLHPGPDFDFYALAALAGTTPDQASALLGQLARAHLIQPVAPDRFGMHDLLRAYAAEQAGIQDTEEQRRAALTRLFDHYLHSTAAAMDTLFPADRHRRPRISESSTPVPPLACPLAARTWLDCERPSLVAIAAHTADHGWPGHTIRLAATLFRYLDTGGHHPEAVAIHGHARDAARHTGDLAAEAEALISSGLAEVWQGRCDRATGLFQQSLSLVREADDRSGEARALHNLGVVGIQQSRYEQAARHEEQALDLYRETGDRSGEIRALQNLGLIDARQGRYQQAASRYRQALALSRHTGDRNGEAHTVANLGDIDRRRGRYQQAADRHRQALVLYQETGDRPGEAHALADLGDVDWHQGRYRQAARHHRRALEIFREIGDQSGEAEALNGLGAVLLATGQHGHAQIQYTIALNLATQVGDRHQQARAHDGLAHCHHAAADPVQARRHWQEALALYASLSVPEADQVRAQLTAAHESSQRDR